MKLSATLLALLLIIGLVLFTQVYTRNQLPDFANHSDTQVMKEAFYRYMTPIIVKQNVRIDKQRASLLSIKEKSAGNDKLGWLDRYRLKRIAEDYDNELIVEDIDVLLQALLLQVDTLPVELVVVQAAKESGWGRSRFAVEANNLFGRWCFNKGCGMVPENRAKGKTHEVKRFDTVSDAVDDYLHVVNTLDAYEPLWLIRATQRKNDEPLDGIKLANGLLKYSERRQAYVDEVKSMIRQYRSFQEKLSNSKEKE